MDQLEERFPAWKEDVTSSLVAACCAVMRMKDDAAAFIGLYRRPGAGFRGGALDALAVQALRVSMVARYFPDLLEHTRSALADELVDATGGGRYVSLSAALAVRALLDLEEAVPVPSGVSLRCTAMQPGFEEGSFLPQELYGMLTLSAPGCASYALAVPEGTLSEGMEVTRTYLDAEGNPVTSVHQGDVITVSVTARAYGGVLNDVAIVDLLPGGFEMELAAPVHTGDAADARADRREDRMIFFASLGTEPSTFTYAVRAVNRGVYALPAVQAEAMYDRSVRAHAAGGTIVVE